ncbi:MAG: bifunctional homocysteine S-methyltransferase/methylenetetrahydrofolate reductase [Chloroflexi bacterium RBG_19FT_COMBO_56_12]|nr:MAG: bifunctional homocysteine S-methyltransferase/methylenetetrahydrofolate reductase [Chloroflexi bacterium RBG_19FT_COMBO_56_12]
MNGNPNSKFFTWLDQSRTPLLGDGAMGTMLNSRGVGFNQCFDALNLTNPALVADIHRAYIEAGAQIIQTNTFGANRYKLAEHNLEDKVEQINRAGVELARRVILASFKEVLLAGDVGPLGVHLAPFGRVQPEQARQVFAEQIGALCAAGADLLILETFSDLHEISEALAAARGVCDLPIIASLTFTRDDCTLLGDSPAKVATTLHAAGADVIGVNCSGGPAQIWRIFRQMHGAVPEARFSAMPNAGWPERVGGRIMYPASPDYFGEYALAFHQAGVSLIGGCCGTTPQHIAALREALQNPMSGNALNGVGISLVESEAVATAFEKPSQFAQKLADGKFVVSVEMDPPRGLSTHKLLAGASLLAEAGADVINVADSPMARMRMSPWAVCSVIQREFNIETVLHFPTRGRNLLRVQGDLLAAHALGIRNVFVVMGDPTEIGDYPDAMDDYDLVPSGLIKLIKEGFNVGVDHAGVEIGQPTSFFVGCALNLTAPDLDLEVKNLRRKIKAGADFILTQPVFQPLLVEPFLKRYTELSSPIEIPILVGVLPLFSPRHAAFLHNEVPGIEIPEEIHARLKKAGESAPQVGIRIATELIDQMRSWASGIYLMPAFNRYDLAAEVIEAVNK